MTEVNKPIRVAIYTRKSTDEGLDMQFNSLDAQREAGEAYIASQKSKGWAKKQFQKVIGFIFLHQPQPISTI